MELFRGIEQNFSGVQKHFNVQNIRTGVHVNPVDVHLSVFYNAQNMWNLVNGNPEFTIDVSHRNILIAAGHNVRIDADANRNSWVFGAEMF